jgi:hypothetical protein
MRIRLWLSAAWTAALMTGLTGPGLHAQRAGDPERAPDGKRSGKQLVYADFQNSADGKPVSTRGGSVTLGHYEENPTRPPLFKGHEADSSVPKLVRTSRNDDNLAAAFDYEFAIPNQWAGVTMTINGHPGETGALPTDDVSGYKVMSIQAYATGTSYMRVEVKSNGQDVNLHSGYPMTSFKLKEGFNIYRAPLKSFSQPAWVEGTRIDPKDVLKQLTSVTVSVFCDDCRPQSGTVVVDNIVFEN